MNRNRWAHNFIEAISVALAGEAKPIPHTDHNAWALISWIQAEHGKGDPNPAALWNPLNTTMRMPGSWNFNSVGVQNYPDYETGLHATVKTITAGVEEFGYTDILRHLRRDDPAIETLRAVEDSAWGTGGLAVEVLPGVREHYWEYASAPIFGSA